MVIFSWVEPLGIGGHALLILNQDKTGCYECLYTLNPEDQLDVLKNRASFAAPKQFFGKRISCCGSTFTPYGSLDALQTAIITTRLCISALIGEEKNNPLISWKGDSTIFIQNGYKLSERYYMLNQKLIDLRYQYKSAHCKVCGNG